MLLAAVALAAFLATDTTASAQGYAGARSPEKTLTVSAAPERLGLPAGASARVIAEAAIDRYARRLGLRSTRQVALVEQRPVRRIAGAPGGYRALLFEQRVDGVRVLWSRIVVRMIGRRVVGFTSVSVPLPRTDGVELAAKRIGRERARAVARRAIEQPVRAGQPQLVVHAGTPTRPARSARLACLVQVDAGEMHDDAVAGETHVDSWCVVVDAVTGKRVTVWKGTAAATSRDRAGNDDRPLTPHPNPPGTARPAQTGTIQHSLVLTFDSQQSMQYPEPTSQLRFAWSWSLRRPGGPFSVGNFISGNGYSPFWSGAYVGDNDVDNVASVAGQQAHDWLCKENAWCGADGAKDLSYEPLKVFANHRNTDPKIGGPNQSFADARPDRATVYIGRGAGSNDMLAHEMSHLRWAHDVGELNAQPRPRAVNEALSDMAAFLIDRGTDSNFEFVGLNWRNPPNDGVNRYADHISEYYCGPDDSGGVHWNSTILTKAFIEYYDRVGYEAARAMWNVMYDGGVTPFSSVTRFFSSFISFAFSFGTQQQAIDAFKTVGLDATKPTPTLPC
jgi:Zn-dependent metalloprotease